jgi:hypothetical protein
LHPWNLLDRRLALFVNPPAVLAVGSRQHFPLTGAFADGDRGLEKQLAFPDEADQQIRRILLSAQCLLNAVAFEQVVPLLVHVHDERGARFPFRIEKQETSCRTSGRHWLSGVLP